MNRVIRFKFGAEMEDAPLLRTNQKMTPQFICRSYVTKFRNFGTPYNILRNRAIRFKFGRDIQDGPLMRMDLKTTPKWALPGSRNPISKFRDSFIIFERIKLSASNLVHK